MLVNCNSCQKKFTVPDEAITDAGRLLQCGSCGNKWTQYPIRLETVKEEKLIKKISKTKFTQAKQSSKINKIKNSTKKKKREINLYSEEYLKKKHGLTIEKNLVNKKNKLDKKTVNKSNFFNYLLITIIIIITFFGVLNLTKDLIVLSFPQTEPYLNSLYEVLEILRAIISNFLN